MPLAPGTRCDQKSRKPGRFGRGEREARAKERWRLSLQGPAERLVFGVGLRTQVFRELTFATAVGGTAETEIDGGKASVRFFEAGRIVHKRFQASRSRRVLLFGHVENGVLIARTQFAGLKLQRTRQQLTGLGETCLLSQQCTQ